MNFSTTQATNLATIVGVIGFVLNHFHVNIGSDELTQVISAGLVLGGALVGWYHRWQKGDLTVAGFRK